MPADMGGSAPAENSDYAKGSKTLGTNSALKYALYLPQPGVGDRELEGQR